MKLSPVLDVKTFSRRSFWLKEAHSLAHATIHIVGYQSHRVADLHRAIWQAQRLVLPWQMGRTPSTAGTFRKKFRKNSGKTPETLSERFLEFPSRVRLGCPKPYNSRHLRLPERFQNSLPSSSAGDASFFQKWFRRGPLRAGHGIPSSTGWFYHGKHPQNYFLSVAVPADSS